MTDWIAWFVAAGIVVILELFTGTFYLLMIAVGLAAGGLAGLAGVGATLQLISAATVGGVATYALRHGKLGQFRGVDAARDPNVNLDIGQVLTIEHWGSGTGKEGTSRVMYRGALWDVELEPGATACPGAFTIREIRGSHLIVTNCSSPSK